MYIQTRCGGSGRGGGYKVTTYAAWVSATWGFAGTVVTSARLASAPAGLDPAFSASDSSCDRVYNTLSAINVAPANCSVGNTSYCTYRACLNVPLPGAPSGVMVTLSSGGYVVAWTPNPTGAAAITSTTVTATPVGSSAPTVTAVVNGTTTNAVLGPLSPQTTYAITVAATDGAGTGPSSASGRELVAVGRGLVASRNPPATGAVDHGFDLGAHGVTSPARHGHRYRARHLPGPA